MFYSGGGGERFPSWENNPKWLIFPGRRQKFPKPPSGLHLRQKCMFWEPGATRTEGRGIAESLSSIDAKDMLWFSAFLGCVSKIKPQSELLTYEKMNFKLSFLAEFIGYDIKNWLLRTERILLSREHSNSKHRRKIQFNNLVAAYSWTASMCQVLSEAPWKGGE